MSPLNVHNQIYPICGKLVISNIIQENICLHGIQSSTDNESCSTVIENKKTLYCKQIAGVEL